MAYDPDDLISTAQKRLEQAKAADQHNRDEAETDLLFRVLKQWDESVMNDRTQADPPRPCMVVDRLSAFCNQVVNEIRQSKPSPSVGPRGDGANKETAEVIEGKVRAILYDSDSELAFQEAAKYAVCSSTGHFRLDPEMVDEDTNQQTLRVNPIFDPSTVYTDPFAKMPGKTDARWRLVINIMSRIEYKERWPNAQATASDFFDKDRAAQGWMDPSGDKESVMVAEYWCVEPIKGNPVALGGEDEDDPKEWPDGGTYDKAALELRRVKPKAKQKHRVVLHIIDGVEELEPPTERPGEIIPIFTVEGESFWVKGKRYVTSLIRAARDIQRLYNWEATKEVEILAMQATSPYLVTPKQVQNHESQWQNAPNQNYFYLKYNSDPDAPGPPNRTNIEAPIQAISMAKQTTAQEIKDVIGLQDPNLGRAQSADQSGLAIQKLRSEGDLSTYHYQDNLSRTLKVFCKVLVDWLPYYHDVEEEMLILKPDMQQDLIKVNTKAPYTDPKSGKTYHHQLTKGEYEVIVDIGPSYATAREEEAAFMSKLISSVPDAFWIVGDLLLRNRDSAGADEAADRVKRAIAIKTPGLIQDDQAQMPPAASAQIAQMQSQMQQMEQAMQQMGMVIKTKQIESQGRIQVEKTKQETAVATAAIKAHTATKGSELDHRHAMFKTTLEANLKAAQHALEMFHESEMAPGPDQGPQGLHPSAIPEPAPAGGAPTA